MKKNAVINIGASCLKPRCRKCGKSRGNSASRKYCAICERALEAHKLEENRQATKRWGLL